MQYNAGLQLQVDTTYDIDDNNSYIIVSYHRGNPTVDKSVWDNNCVDYHGEVQCFINALNRNWTNVKGNKRFCWGIRYLNRVQKVGTGTEPEKKTLYIAQFKNELDNRQWHGYPVDYTNSNYKVPSNVLECWEESNIISKSQKSRMKRCFECI